MTEAQFSALLIGDAYMRSSLVEERQLMAACALARQIVAQISGSVDDVFTVVHESDSSGREVLRWWVAADWRCTDGLAFERRCALLASLARQCELTISVLLESTNSTMTMVFDPLDAYGQRILVYDAAARLAVHEFNDALAEAIACVLANTGDEPLRMRPFNAYIRTPFAHLAPRDVPADGNCFFHAVLTSASQFRPPDSKWPHTAAELREAATASLLEHDAAEIGVEAIARQLAYSNRDAHEQALLLSALAPESFQQRERWLVWARGDLSTNRAEKIVSPATNPALRMPDDLQWPVARCDACGNRSQRAGKRILAHDEPTLYEQRRAARKLVRQRAIAARCQYETALQRDLADLMRESSIENPLELVRRVLRVYATPGFYADDVIFRAVARVFGRPLVIWSAHDQRFAPQCSIVPATQQLCQQTGVDWHAAPLHIFNRDETHYLALVYKFANDHHDPTFLAATESGRLCIRSVADAIQTELGVDDASSRRCVQCGMIEK